MTSSCSEPVTQPRNDELSPEEAVLFRFYQKNIGDWLSGVKGMTLEIEGAYSRFIDHLYHRGKPFPDDDRFMSAVMSIPVRVWKRVKTVLIEAGKIIVKAGCLTNSRFETERKKRAAELRKKAETALNTWNKRRIYAVSTAKNPEKVNENNDAKMHACNNHNQRQSEEKEGREETTTLAGAKFERTKENLDRLLDRLLDACNGKAADPANAPGMLAVGEPIRWLDSGCDLELDILPTIKQRAGSARPRSIRSWTYFTQAVAEAKADRERPMPVVEAAPTKSGWQPRSVPEPAWKRQYEVAI
jgi:uncharacterized protein YdaU (DUF1376 family)